MMRFLIFSLLITLAGCATETVSPPSTFYEPLDKPTDIATADDIDVCGYAIDWQTTENDAFSWSENTQWVAEAKKRGLDCGTTSIASQNKIVASTQSQNRQILQNTNRREIYSSSSSNNNSRGASSEIHKAKCKNQLANVF